MGAGTTFRRYEYKYPLSKDQYHILLQYMKGYMMLDEFGKSTINNIYFDTPDFLLIRRSLEKPVYKEKLRLRWYGPREESTGIYVELKKKYKGVVYKRRMKQKWENIEGYFLHGVPFPIEKKAGNLEQIAHELDYFMDFYGNLEAMVFLSYERNAYYGLEDPDFRMTFDFNISFTQDHIYEQTNLTGQHILTNDTVLLEVKTSQGLPRWLLDFFANESVYRASFSKYGRAYQDFLVTVPQEGGEIWSA